MHDRKVYHHLNVLLARSEFSQVELQHFLCPNADATPLEVLEKYNIDGVLYVKKSLEKRPRWAQLIDEIVGTEVGQLSNKSSSAVLIIRVKGRVVAFTFGYGRYLLSSDRFEQGFGLRTALNTLDHQSLRSVDLHTLDDQPIQRKSQATRGSEASVFGIDIFRDVLRAVTGSPRDGIGYKNIAGRDAIYSCSLEMRVEEVPQIAADIVNYYELGLYKDSFGWVDNIRRVKDESLVSELDSKLLTAVKDKDAGIVVTLPEIVEWDSVLGFSFTRSKRALSPTIDTDKYLENIAPNSVSIKSIRRDRLYITDVNDNESSHSVYKCLYFEVDELHSKDSKFILFCGNWYEVDKAFIGGIHKTMNLIDLCQIDFPGVETWQDGGKFKIETEADYNRRTADRLNCHLLDKRLVKSSKTTSAIELCDLLTNSKQLIHVKHGKGGSAGLSHLFAQGCVSAEVLLGDRDFRVKSRDVLESVDRHARELVPVDDFRSADYEIVFLILGDATDKVKDVLPFFSKVNLTRVYESLTQRGYAVRIAGARKVARGRAA